MLAKVRDWVKMMPGKVTLKNAYKDRPEKHNPEGKKVPQTFTFIAREGAVCMGAAAKTLLSQSVFNYGYHFRLV